MKRSRLSPRKEPRQRRSEETVRDILRGAIRVLRKEGGRRFTTIRVAEEAGLSVGSLYQYFPNKEALLFRLQSGEWLETSDGIWKIAAEPGPASKRLRRMVRFFFRTEADEADLRKAMAETGLSFEETPEYRKLQRENRARMAAFLAEAAPKTAPEQRPFLADFWLATLSALGEAATSEKRTEAELNRWADLCARMLLATLEKNSSPNAKPSRDTSSRNESQSHPE